MRKPLYPTLLSPGEAGFVTWGAWGRLRLEADYMHLVEIGIGLFAVAATQIDMYNVYDYWKTVDIIYSG